MFSLRHLLIFKTICETGSFTGAARQLFLTQSAVSHAVRDLETEAGTVLFDRLGKQICLTSSGRQLLTEITPLLASCEALEKRIRRLEDAAPVHIVSSITIAAYHLPRILLKYQEKWPDVPVYTQVVPAASALEILKSGGADIALIEGLPPAKPFISYGFASYDLAAACAPSYAARRFPQKNSLSVTQFCAEKLLLREKGSAIRDCLDSALLLLGAEAAPVWTSVNSPALIEAAKAGLGITVLPALLLKDHFSSGSLLPLFVEGLQLSNRMYLVYHGEKYLTSSLQDLLSLIR